MTVPPDGRALDRLLRRDRRVTSLGLTLLCLLAWTYLLRGAGLGMSARAMAGFALFPHRLHADTGMPGMVAGPSVWSPASWLLVLAMWWVMMIAMMAPSTAPTLLLYARIYRHSAAGPSTASRKLAPTAWFLLGYLLAWFVFSLGATILTWMLQQAGIVSDAMRSASRWLSATLLLAAGFYQLSPLKQACLAHCRAPAQFLAQHWRPGISGALRLGLAHGSYCLGCCWLLMALLCVGGVMNPVWIALLAILVLIEKLAPGGRSAGLIAGGLLIAWGVATLLV